MPSAQARGQAPSIHAFADGIKHKPETAFGNVKDDVMAAMLPGYVRPNFCEMIAAAPFRD